jgi:MFS family permease
MTARMPYARNVAVLATCQALLFMANTVVFSVSALVGLQYAPSESLSTLALGFQFCGVMLATLPASFLMQRYGRRAGFIGGGAIGMAAGLLATYAIIHGSFQLFCAAGLLYGMFAACGQYYRFAAADVADAALGRPDAPLRGRAIGWVMAGGTVAAVAGPELAKATRELLLPFTFAGCFAAVVVLAALSAAVASQLRLPPPAARRQDAGGRPLALILRQPRAIVAVVGSIIAYLTMNLLMTATPLAMLACGHDFADSAFVIQWHVLGMFAPSFVTGQLVGRFGPVRVMAAGLALLLACIGINLTGITLAHFTLGLLLLGVGWNFLFVGGTTLLTTCHRADEKAKVQGANDFLIFASVAVSASSSGILHHALGWTVMNLIALPGLLLVAVLLLAAQLRQAAAGQPAGG